MAHPLRVKRLLPAWILARPANAGELQLLTVGTRSPAQRTREPARTTLSSVRASTCTCWAFSMRHRDPHYTGSRYHGAMEQCARACSFYRDVLALRMPSVYVSMCAQPDRSSLGVSLTQSSCVRTRIQGVAAIWLVCVGGVLMIQQVRGGGRVGVWWPCGGAWRGGCVGGVRLLLERCYRVVAAGH